MGVQAFAWPTLPGCGSQVILSREDPKNGTRFRLFVDERGAGAFELSRGGEAKTTMSTGRPLLARRWCLIDGSYDAKPGRLTVRQHPLKTHPHVEDGGAASADIATGLVQSGTTATVMIAARPAVDIPAWEHVNGRIEVP